MCRRVTCTICGKATWAGCGQHVNEVMAAVPRSDRCHGHTDAERAAATSGSIFSRLFRRSS
jgi:hypothetical protein